MSVEFVGSHRIFFTSLLPYSSGNDNVYSEKLEYNTQWWGNEEKYERETKKCFSKCA